MRYLSLSFLIVLMVACGSPEATGPNYIVDGYALGGYDPVSYFEQGEPKKGVSETLEYQGVTYLFSSTKNKNLFEANPEKYVPEYGGWCAYAVAESSTRMAPDPNQWQIQDGKLLMFTSNFMTTLTGDLKDDWNEDPQDYKTRADQNWQTMSD